jgi:3',5'-cyclic AMP phosphodiesterase CpdA
MKTDDRIRIVHTSDIHFCSSFDRSLWKQVKVAIEAEEPDLLVVSGDFVESPFPLMLILARREMTSFAKQLDVPLVAVPGNHDVAFAGNIRIWPFTRLFRAIFSGQYDKGCLKYFPTFSDFYSKNALVRLLWRIPFYVFILLLWLTRFAWCRGSQDEVLQFPEAAQGSKKFCSIIGLDTNRSFFLAAGKVAKAQLTSFGSAVLGFRSKENLQKALECRILVMHHHPIPIPYMQEGALEFEPFLVLRNAGTVLSEVWSSGFDLILHGHRHRSCFSRIAYGDGVLRAIPVLAAASPTVETTSPLGNSFNIVDVYPNGRLGIRIQSYGGGVNIRGKPEDAHSPIAALGIDELKFRNFHRALEAQGAYCEEYRREISISHLGTTRTRVAVKGFIATHATVESHPHRFKVDLGLIDPRGIVLCDESPGVALLKSDNDPRQPSSDVHLKVGVPQANAGSPVSYVIYYPTANNFRLSKWECVEEGRDAEESIAFRVKYPVKSLVLRVQLPSNQFEPRPILRCMRPTNFANLSIDKESRMVTPPSGESAADWVPDFEITEHEASNLTNVSDQTWQLTIRYPMVGYKYEIAWKVKDLREVTPEFVGETIAFRLLALEYRKKRLNPSASPGIGVQRLLRLLHLLLDEFGKTYRSRDTQRETIRACLFSYDSAAKLSERVVAIEEAVLGPRFLEESDPLRLEQYRMQFGEGVAGLSLKTAHPKVYFNADTHIAGKFDSGYFELVTKLGIKGVVAIPLYHPAKWKELCDPANEIDYSGADVPSIYETVGVLTFASDSPGTRIARLCEAERGSKAKREAMRRLTFLIQSAVPVIYDCLLAQN